MSVFITRPHSLVPFVFCKKCGACLGKMCYINPIIMAKNKCTFSLVYAERRFCKKKENVLNEVVKGG